MHNWQLVGPGIYRIQDTCSVYAVVAGEECVLIDFGSGRALEFLEELGVKAVIAVLVTHHHRDQVQGLPLATARGIPVFVPHTEQDLFHSVDQHWQQRELRNNYNGRQDRFSLLEPIAVTGTLQDYSEHQWLDLSWQILPTPGHTTGSVSFLLQREEQCHVFVGDLFYRPGKFWTLSSTQWTYNGGEGLALTAASLLQLQKLQPTALYTGHGGVVTDPLPVLGGLLEDLRKFLAFRRHNPRLFSLAAEPLRPITEHLLFNRTSMANSYVLLSSSGKALFIDYGYDFIGGIAAGSDRASRRPWLYSLPALKEQYGVASIDVVIPTHYHDDHVAGLNLLRDVEGTQVWTTAEIRHILEHPEDYDLPCLWYDTIPVDRVLPEATPVKWEEYELCLHPISGHTRYSVMISVVVDGKRMVFTGDQYAGEADPNYVYANRFGPEDFVHSARLLQALQPDWILSGHWEPRPVQEDDLTLLAQRGQRIAELHKTLLPLDQMDLGMEGFAARITPYNVTILPGTTRTIAVEVRNPLPQAAQIQITPVLPTGFTSQPAAVCCDAGPREVVWLSVDVQAQAHAAAWRQPLAVDVLVGDVPLGQQAEALLYTTPLRGGGVDHDRSGTKE